MHLSFSPAADADLTDIASFIARDNVDPGKVIERPAIDAQLIAGDRLAPGDQKIGGV